MTAGADMAGENFRLVPPGGGSATLTVRLRMLSDWHVGTGTGQPGGVDRLVARDPDNLPFVPAKSLTGIYRDACERLATALGPGWHDVVEVLFGSQPALNTAADAARPRPAALSLRPARVPEKLAAALGGKAMAPLRAAMTFVKPGVAIDPKSGRALDQHLRFEEMARLGTVLEAPALLTLPDGTGDDAVRAASALLLAATRLVEALGGKRRRGAGRLELTIDGFGKKAVDAAINWLEKTPAAPAMPDRAVPPPAADARDDGAVVGDEAGFCRLSLTVTLDTPLSVPERTLGNVGMSLDFVPGTLLLPAVTRALAAVPGLSRDQVAAAVRRGDLRVLPLTPEIAGRRGLPAPAVLAREKDSADTDFLNRRIAKSDKQLKPVRGRYVAVEPGGDGLGLCHGGVDFTLHTHNTIDDKVQRPTEAVGGVYSYLAIPAGTVLRTEILARPRFAHALSGRAFCTGIAGNHSLGRSKKDDFGAVRIAVEGDSAPAVSAAAPHGGAAGSMTVVVWCQSDVLLYGPTLRPAVTAEDLAGAVQKLLGGTVTVAPPEDGRDGTVIRVRRLESWHEGWGLPRPSLTAIAAGSCAVLSVTPPPSPEALQRLAVEGLGQRRAEGYGAIAVNPPLLDQDRIPEAKDVTASSNKKKEPAPVPIPASPFVHLIEEEAWRTALRSAAIVAGADRGVRERLGLGGPASPGMSQLGNLRVQVQSLGGNAPAEDVLAWFTALESVKQRRKRWPEPARLAFRTLFADGGAVWDMLGTSFRPPPTLTGRSEAEMKNALWAEAVRAFVESVFHNHKRALDAAAGQASAGEAGHGA